MPALAITDHGTMFGVIEFYNAAKAAGIKPIIGLEAYLAPRSMKDRDAQLDKQSPHLLLLAENETGYQNLLKIATAAQLEGFYYYPRIDQEFLAAHSEGLDLHHPAACRPRFRAHARAGHLEEARQQAGLVLRGLRHGQFLPRTAAARHPGAGANSTARCWTWASATRPATSPPTMCITSTRRTPACRISCWPSRPARCSPTPTACA